MASEETSDDLPSAMSTSALTDDKNDGSVGIDKDQAPKDEGNSKRLKPVNKDETMTTSAAGDVSKGPAAVPINISAPTKAPDGSTRVASSSKKAIGVGGLPQYNILRFPLRVGITWKKGERLEAMDFSRTWYPSKIVDIDEEEKYVLIHFDGWNSRYDEWVPMDSEKLRPQTRHSERKEKNLKKNRNVPQPIYRPGEVVMARWTDCKKYPARIIQVMPDGTFEVVFYDGVTRTVQPINVQPLPAGIDVQNLQINPSPSTGLVAQGGPKSSFKNIPLELPESVVRRSKVGTEGTLSSGVKKNRHMEKSIKKSLAHISGTFKKSPLKAHRLKALQGSSQKNPGKAGSHHNVNEEILYPSSSLSSSSVSSMSPCSSTSSSPATVSSSTLVTPSSTDAMGVAEPTSTTGKLVMVIKKDQDIQNSESVLASSSTITGPVQTSPTMTTGPKRVKKRGHIDYSLSPRKKRRHKKVKDTSLVPNKVPSGTGGQPARPSDRGRSALTGSTMPPGYHIALLPQDYVPAKAFLVEEDHNPYKCPFDGCTKEFRKENLLTSHIKYYHTAPNTSAAASSAVGAANASVAGNVISTQAASASSSSVATGPLSPSFSPALNIGVTSPVISSITPVSSFSNLTANSTPAVGQRRRRRKTDSLCSTDSDISVSSRGKSKRQRHDSEISVTGSPDIVSKDVWADVKLKAPQDVMMEEYGETEEEEQEADLVNCVCQIRETNGLMIQCDVCMCWQHFTCVDTEGTGRPPANYVCLACERPKGSNNPGTSIVFHFDDSSIMADIGVLAHHSTPASASYRRVRDSCKYSYDMGWERRGELPVFPFVPNSNQGEKAGRLKQVANNCHVLTSHLQGIKAVLHSMRRQIKISKEEDEPEFQLWQTDWDNWVKPEEDLTLTPPRSVEPVPSPAPSTFMFPPAPNSPPLPQSTTTTLQSPPPQSTTATTTHPPLPQSTTASSDLDSQVSSEILNLTSASSLASLSSLATSTYQDSFKTWLTAKDAPRGTISTLSSLASMKLSAGSPSAINVASTHDQPATKNPSSSTASQSNQLTLSLGTVKTLESTPPSTSDSSSTLCQSSSCPVTPPMSSGQGIAPPPTPLSARSSSRIQSTLVGKDVEDDKDLVRDLFALGPGGDASSLSSSAPQSAASGIGDERKTASSADRKDVKDKKDSDQIQSESLSSETVMAIQSSAVPSSSSSSTVSTLPLQSIVCTSTTTASLPSSSLSSTSTVPTQTSAVPTQTSTVISTDSTTSSCNTVNPLHKTDERTGKSESNNTSSQVSKIKVSTDPANASPPRPLHELYVDINNGGDMDVDDDNDTDTAEESAEPYRDCERNLLVHITRTHGKVEDQLDQLEKQIEELENSDLNDPNIQLSGENALNDVPAMKKSLGKLVRSLGKIRHLSLYR